MQHILIQGNNWTSAYNFCTTSADFVRNMIDSLDCLYCTFSCCLSSSVSAPAEGLLLHLQQWVGRFLSESHVVRSPVLGQLPFIVQLQTLSPVSQHFRQRYCVWKVSRMFHRCFTNVSRMFRRQFQCDIRTTCFKTGSQQKILIWCFQSFRWIIF